MDVSEPRCARLDRREEQAHPRLGAGRDLERRARAERHAWGGRQHAGHSERLQTGIPNGEEGGVDVAHGDDRRHGVRDVDYREAAEDGEPTFAYSPRVDRTTRGQSMYVKGRNPRIPCLRRRRWWPAKKENRGPEGRAQSTERACEGPHRSMSERHG